MGRVAREVVQKAGIDVDKLLDMLLRNASAELTTFYYYTILRVNLIGMDGEGLKEITEDPRIEDRNHFEALVPRVGREPAGRHEGVPRYFSPPAGVAPGAGGAGSRAEGCAVAGYSHVCNLTARKDHRTYDSVWRPA